MSHSCRQTRSCSGGPALVWNPHSSNTSVAFVWLTIMLSASCFPLSMLSFIITTSPLPVFVLRGCVCRSMPSTRHRSGLFLLPLALPPPYCSSSSLLLFLLPLVLHVWGCPKFIGRETETGWSVCGSGYQNHNFKSCITLPFWNMPFFLSMMNYNSFIF